jgi:aryl-alcohol dehydrogenase-like predicted oxidoreductase
MIPLCLDQGVGIVPWSPLARGLLAGKRTRTGERQSVRAETDGFQDELYGRPEDFDVAEAAAQVAERRGVPPAQVGLAWLMHKPSVVPIVGATREDHIGDARAAAELSLSADEIAVLEAPYRPNSVRGHD